MFYLGVDGGGSKTAFVITDDKGKIHAYLTKATCHYIQIGFASFEAILRDGITELCQQIGISVRDLAYSFLGLPGYGEIKDDLAVLEKIVANILQSERFRCGNDVEAGWAGSLAGQPGINLVGGTGAIGFGRDQDGNTARASGWGYFCGDEGSAYWLGRKVISLFGKEADGREEKTPLYDIVREKFKLTRDFDLISIIYNTLEMKRDRIAELALLLYQAAEEGDPNAVRLYREAAHEHSLTVKALLKRLNFSPEQEILISYSGGVFKGGSYILNPLVEYIDQSNIRLLKPILQPVVGAALYAFMLEQKLVQGKMIIEVLKEEEKRMGLSPLEAMAGK